MVLTFGEVSDFLSVEPLAQEKSGVTQELAASFKHNSNGPQAKVPQISNNCMISRIFSSAKYINTFSVSICNRSIFQFQ